MPWFDKHSAEHRSNIVHERECAMRHIQQSIAGAISDPNAFDPGIQAESNPQNKAAATYVMQHIHDPDLIIRQREQKLRVLRDASKAMEPATSRAKGLIKPFNYPVAKRINSGLLFIMMLSTSYPDATIPTDLIVGMQNVGHFCASGSHAPSRVPSKRDELDPGYNSRLIGSIRRKALKATGEDLSGLFKCYDKTTQEVSDDWMCGPFTKEQCDLEFPDGWHASHRFPQFRYPGAPCRPCDNFRTSGINDFNSFEERITCENAGFPARAGRLFYDLGFRGDFGHGTDDLTKAYRQCCVRNHAYNVIAVWNPYIKRVEFFILRGFPFGSAAAVLQFNRVPQFIVHFVRCYFGITCSSYYDDYDVAEPMSTVHHAQYILLALHELIGLRLDKDKHLRAAITGNPFLGIVTDFTCLAAGILLLRIKPERRDKLCAILRQLRVSNAITPAEASSVRGKLYFSSLTAFNKIGRAHLRAFTERQYSRATLMTPELLAAVEFFIDVLPVLPPRRVDLGQALRAPLLIWSDAMYEGDLGALGFIALDTATGLFYYSSYTVPAIFYTMWRPLRGYIGILEVLAVLFTYLTLPRLIMRGRPVIHWVDNTSAIAGAVKGYSPKWDTAIVLGFLHAVFYKLTISPWFQYVASKANCSDGPSRGDYAIPMALGARWLDPQMFTIAEWAQPLSSWFAEPARSIRTRSGAGRRAARQAAIP